MNSPPAAGATPSISVIIPSVNGVPMITDTLAALEAQSARPNAEVLVLDCSTEETRRVIRDRFPSVELIAFEKRLSIPELRAEGLRRARGNIVVFLEDHCLAAPGWLERIAASHAAHPHTVISGGVTNGATERARDWAHYFCEYAPHQPPLREGETNQVAGNSASYKRAALEALGSEAFRPRWEYFLRRRLLERGYRFYCDPRLEVCHRISFSLAELLRQRFHYSRSFAAMRSEDATRWRRIVLAAGSLLVPPLMLGRVTATVRSHRTHLREFCAAWPLLVLLALAAGLGELIGAVAGPGTSLEKVR